MMKTLAAVLVLALAACGKSDAPATGPAAGPLSEGSGAAAPGTDPRSGKIDPPPLKPGAPSPEDRAANRMAWRQQLDTDGDGQISETERQAGRIKRRSDMRARMDTDGDGKISAAERTAVRHQRAQDMIMRFDNDGDGKLGTTEMPQTPWIQGDPTVDANRDGFLTADELETAMNARWEKRRAERQSRGGAPGGGGGPAPGSEEPDDTM